MPWIPWMLALVQSPVDAHAPTPFDRVIPITIDESDPVLDGHGRAERFEYEASFSGTLHVWASGSGGLDVFLRVEESDGKLLSEDENSGGGLTPYVKLEVEAGRRLSIVAAVSSEGEALGALEVAVLAAPETQATRAGAEQAKSQLVEAKRLHDTGDSAGARELVVGALEQMLSIEDAQWSQLVCARAWEFSAAAQALSLPEAAVSALTAAYRHVARVLPRTHRDAQATAMNLGANLKAVGDIPAARALFERVVEVRTLTLPEEHPALQAALGNLAVTIKAQGDVRRALEIEQRVLDVFTRTLPPEHPHLQQARLSLAATLDLLGDFEEARALVENVVEVRTRTLDEDHPELLRARSNLGAVLHSLEDFQAARVQFERVLAGRSRVLPEGHLDLQSARLNLASACKSVGDVARARLLEESVLEVLSRELPEDHFDLQAARANLAGTLKLQGDLAGARALEEHVLEVFSRTMPETHTDLLGAMLNLAATMDAMGDARSAHDLVRKVVEVRSQCLPAGHPELLAAQANLASTIRQLGDLSGAQAHQERVLEAYSKVLPEDHFNVQKARAELAATLLGSAARAGRRGTSSASASDWAEAARQRAGTLLRDACVSDARAARRLQLESSGREAEEQCAIFAERLDFTLSAVFGYGGLGPIEELAAAAFELGEATRNAAVSSSSIASRAARTQECTDARERLRAAASELARLVQAGSKSEEYREALARRETAERELLAELDSESGGRSRNFALDARSLSATLETGDALVAYRVYMRHDLELHDESESSDPRESTVESLCAFVVRPSRSEEATSPQSALHLIDLGPTAPIEAAVDAWREALGAAGERGRPVAAARPSATSLAELGSDLRRRVIDPLHETIGPLERIVFVPDGPLQLVPLDALPSATSRGLLVGDEWRVETRTTLGELLDAHTTTEGPVELVAVGDVDFARVSDEGPGEEAKQLGTSVELADAGALERAKTASAPRDGDLAALFAPLPGSLREIDGLEERFKSSVGADAGFTRLAGKGASRAALLSAAPRARFLHIATHGWFAPDAMRTWRDREPLDAWSGLGLPQSGEQTVRGMSPMLLCGLALAGANLPEDTLGRAPGLVTADELSTLDLGNCELAVLSACDTARGDRRAAGQGIASLQKALQIAGARSVITSLWRVPDEATKDLMLEFYRRLWIEKQPKRKALWEAKRRLREAKDEHGNPRYALRDWAAWVLTGEPD